MSSLALIFVWLDKRVGNLPGSNDILKSKFRKLLNPIRQFDRPTACFDHIELSLRDKRVIFLTSDAFADEQFLIRLAGLTHVKHLYVYNQHEQNYQMLDEHLREKLAWKRVIQFDEYLYEQMVKDLLEIAVKEIDRLGKGRDAKDVIDLSRKYLLTIDEKDEDFQRLETHILMRLNQL